LIREKTILVITVFVLVGIAVMFNFGKANGSSNDNHQAAKILDEIELSSRTAKAAETAKLFSKLPASFDDKKSLLRAAQLHRRLVFNFWAAGGDQKKPMAEHIMQASAFAHKALSGKELAAFEAEIGNQLMTKGMPLLAIPILLNAVKVYEQSGVPSSNDVAMAKYDLGLCLTTCLFGAGGNLSVNGKQLCWADAERQLSEAASIFRRTGNRELESSCMADLEDAREMQGQEPPPALRRYTLGSQ